MKAAQHAFLKIMIFGLNSLALKNVATDIVKTIQFSY